MPRSPGHIKSLVITPTYNERENIETLLARIHDVVPEAHVLVVDDNSPDGTGAYVKEQAEAYYTERNIN